MPSFCWPLPLGPKCSMMRPRTGQRNEGVLSWMGLLVPDSVGPTGAIMFALALALLPAPVLLPLELAPVLPLPFELASATCCFAVVPGLADAGGDRTAGVAGVGVAAACFAGVPSGFACASFGAAFDCAFGA